MKQWTWTWLALAGAAACSSATGSSETGATLGDANQPGTPDASTDASTDATAQSPPQVVQRLAETAIVTDEKDPSLVNAWGLAFNPAGTAWVVSNGKGTANVYGPNGAPAQLTVTIPPPANDQPPSAPTGESFNQNTGDFLGDKFLFATEDGTIAGWQSGSSAVIRFDNSASGAVYKGMDIANATQLHAARLFAANFHAGSVDVFDSQFHPVQAAGGFTDPSLPGGFAPFNVSVVARTFVLVTYALQDAQRHDDVPGVGNGFVDVFDLDGHFQTRLISAGVLNAPWGLAFGANHFGNLAGTLIVGNFGDGHINAFRISFAGQNQNGQNQNAIGPGVMATLLGAVGDTNGNPLAIDGLWALRFGIDAGGFSSNTLFFTAGPGQEKHAIFGSLNLP